MKSVYIWHGDGWGGDKLNWMYAPARKTLAEGFKNYDVKIDVRVKCYDWKLVKPNSIFVWIGEYHADRVPWKQFKQKNIYTIYYQSEPWNEGKKWNFDAQEIWDYSMRNVVEIKKRVKNSKIVRKNIMCLNALHSMSEQWDKDLEKFKSVSERYYFYE